MTILFFISSFGQEKWKNWPTLTEAKNAFTFNTSAIPADECSSMTTSFFLGETKYIISFAAVIRVAKETTKYRATLKLNKRKINFVPKNTKTSHSFINVIFYKFALTKG